MSVNKPRQEITVNAYSIEFADGTISPRAFQHKHEAIKFIEDLYDDSWHTIRQKEKLNTIKVVIRKEKW